ncbi:uncharacterized protein [Halyomorpha halys]|uniref:uncharacterized protein isoform X3 n=1 Tax=Halyomorpha halys TaxID=286706 RepID=UPI0006D50F75
MSTSSPDLEAPVDSRGLTPVIIIPTDEAWVAVLVALCQNILLESVPLTMLLLVSEMQSSSSDAYEQKYRNAAVFFGLSSILTPISCSLANWYSFKVVSVIGPTVIFLAMVLTYFTQHYFGYTFNLFSLSIIGGFGNSLINVTSMCLPTIWFCNRRSIAYRISSFGQSLGLLFVPWFTKTIFIETLKYSITDIYLLFAGMYIPLIAIGFAVPKIFGIKLKIRDTKKATNKVKFRDQETAEILARSMSIVMGKKLSYLIFRTYNNLLFPRTKDMIKERSLFIMIPELVMIRSVDPPCRTHKRIKPTNPKIVYDSSDVSFSFYGVQDVQMLVSRTISGHGCRPFYRVDIFFSADVTELNIYSRQVNQLDYHMAVSRAMSKKDYRQEVDQRYDIFPEAISRTFLSMLDIVMWKQFYFVLLQLAFALCYFGHFIPFIFINDRCLEFDLADQSLSVINYIGLGHLTARMFSFICSFYCYEVDKNFIFEVLLIIEGGISFITNYINGCGAQLTYGFITGIYMSLSVLTMIPSMYRVTGISCLTNAFGYVLIFQGIGIIAGTLLCGPVAGGVCNRFGFRMTNILGCCLMIIGLGSSYFVSGYFEFLLLYGMMAGCGTSFILMVANVATGFWFESKRTIAFGLVSSASGASVFTVSLSSYIADEWGWRFCFVAWAGMIVILLFGSLLLAPPPMVELESSKPLVGPTQAVDISKITSIVPLEYDKTRVQKLSSKKVYRMSLATGIPVGRVSRPSVTPAPTPIGMGKLFRCCLCCQRCQQSVGSRPLYRKDIFYEGSVYYPAIKNQQNGTTLPLTMTKLPTTNDVKQEVECHCAIPEAVTRAMREMLDWSLLRSPIFLLILASSIVVYMVRYIPFLVLKKYNLPYMDVAAAARTVTMMGLGSLIARASIGFILYFFHNISPLAATIFVTLTGGAIFCCLTLSHKVIYQTALAFLAAALTL